LIEFGNFTRLSEFIDASHQIIVSEPVTATDCNAATHIDYVQNAGKLKIIIFFNTLQVFQPRYVNKHRPFGKYQNIDCLCLAHSLSNGIHSVNSIIHNLQEICLKS